ncbi:hypothetical protein NC652_008088 [Populus alba x Populus x berolinensis]|nr:hypothetical protein NC652_008088 [Populus alba x Populus x berolinensis]
MVLDLGLLFVLISTGCHTSKSAWQFDFGDFSLACLIWDLGSRHLVLSQGLLGNPDILVVVKDSRVFGYLNSGGASFPRATATGGALSSARLPSLWRREQLLSREAERRKRKHRDEAVSFLFCKSLGLPAEELAAGGWFLGMKTEEDEGGRA